MASRLFRGLRYADEIAADIILAESFPEVGLGLAIQNRLRRASGGRTLDGAENPEVNILLVCSGNTCRSPMAEVLMRGIWRSECPGLRLNVWSRGTSAMDGMPATPEAQTAMAARGLDLSGHRARTVTEEDLARAGAVITMTEGHKTTLTRLYPHHAGKVVTLSAASGGAVPGDVSDPIGCGQAAYDKTAQDLEIGLRAICERIKGRLSQAQDGGSKDEDRSGK